jgi:hypothetical protein
MAKNKEKATVASVLYRTSYNFLQVLSSEKVLEIELDGKGNSYKGYLQLSAFNKSKPFLSVTKTDDGVSIKPLETSDAKKVLVKLLAIGAKKFDAPLDFSL